VTEDPFLALGLPPSRDLTDDDVRAAWRRIAAATHPDRDDGGDPARFGAAAAAYAALRTRYGRGEALADLGSGSGRGKRASRGKWGWPRAPGRHGRGHVAGARGARRVHGVGHGRLGRLLLRGAAAAGIGAFAVVAAGWTPAVIGLVTGALTWLVATGRHDLPRRTRELPARAAPRRTGPAPHLHPRPHRPRGLDLERRRLALQGRIVAKRFFFTKAFITNRCKIVT
jgi:curved DNA-binding protein CbpA